MVQAGPNQTLHWIGLGVESEAGEGGEESG